MGIILLWFRNYFILAPERWKPTHSSLFPFHKDFIFKSKLCMIMKWVSQEVLKIDIMSVCVLFILFISCCGLLMLYFLSILSLEELFIHELY